MSRFNLWNKKKIIQIRWKLAEISKSNRFKPGNAIFALKLKQGPAAGARGRQKH